MQPSSPRKKSPNYEASVVLSSRMRARDKCKSSRYQRVGRLQHSSQNTALYAVHELTFVVSIASRFKTMPNLAESNRPEANRDAEDSIEEMASMLLDDTTMNQLNTNTEPGRRLSQMAAAEAYNAGRIELGDSKALPQLPKLVFNGDDAWAMKTAPVVTAAGSSNQMTFNGDMEPSIGQISTQTGNHSRKGSAPTIPRKSSKRKSARPKSNLHLTKGNTSRRDGTAGISRYLAPISSNSSFQMPFLP